MMHDNCHQIICDCHAFNKSSPENLLETQKNLTEAVKSVSVFLLSALEMSPSFTYHYDDSSTLKCPVLNFKYNITDITASNSFEILADYVDKGRSAIFTTNFDNHDSIEELIRYLTELAMEIDIKINSQSSMFPTKVINRVALAKCIELITKIKGPRNIEYVFTLRSGDLVHNVTSHNRVKAVNLLGGKYFDEKPFTANFIVHCIPFGAIENKSVFLLDGTLVNVFIVDRSWIQKFNDEKISIKKNDRIKAMVKVEKSPLTKKPVAYYFLTIKGVNI